MAAPLFVSLLLNILACVLTLSSALVIVWHGWSTRAEYALLSFLGSAGLLQGAVALSHLSLLADFSSETVTFFANIALLGFALTTLTLLAAVLSMAGAMQAAWIVVCRSGLAGLFVVQPALWQAGLLKFPDSPDEYLFGSPYTPAGQIVAAMCMAYMLLILTALWCYWRHIESRLVAGTITVTVGTLGLSIIVPALREYSLPAIAVGVTGGVLGYYAVDRSRSIPPTRTIPWVQALCDVSQTVSSDAQLDEVLQRILALVRSLLHVEAAAVLLVIASDRLEVRAACGAALPAKGRHIRIGEGLAGRVMQTLQPIRVDNYQTWNGRAPAFADLPLYASASVPLLYGQELVGVMNVHEISSIRTFSDHDQAIIDLLAANAATAISISRLKHARQITHKRFEAVMANAPTATLIFDPAGVLCETNAIADNYLQTLFGTSPSSVTIAQLAARAQDVEFSQAMTRWVDEPSTIYQSEVEYSALGRLAIEIKRIDSRAQTSSDILMTMRMVNHVQNDL